MLYRIFQAISWIWIALLVAINSESLTEWSLWAASAALWGLTLAFLLISAGRSIYAFGMKATRLLESVERQWPQEPTKEGTKLVVKAGFRGRDVVLDISLQDHGEPQEPPADETRPSLPEERLTQ